MGKFKRIDTAFQEVAIIQPTIFEDERGFFLETYNRQELAELGVPEEFIQDNVSHSRKGVVRGLHYQAKNAQCKLVRVVQGSIFDVVVDIRKGSKSYGQYVGIELSSKDPSMLYVPVGFAHGFMALADNTEVMYKVSNYYAPEHDAGIRWNDPDLGIPWPVKNYGINNAIISQKDALLPMLRDIQSPFSY